jgi:predicted TIM-barrel fold metal-dependent hydrolase
MSATATSIAPAARPISADSHVCEPPNCYVDYIDPAYRDDAPRVVRDDSGADGYWIKGQGAPVKVPLIAAAGRDPREVGRKYITYETIWPGSWDPESRVKDQDTDGVAAEIVYPSVGMSLCRNPDRAYMSACMQAYNRWLQEFVSGAPRRLFGIGQSAVASVAGAIDDLHRIKALGFKGVMLPGTPGTEVDYDSPDFDPLWEVAVELGLPLSFHILTDRSEVAVRGHSINFWNATVRGVQDIIGMFIFGGVFDRHPDLRLVCVEGDAGWVPHFSYRMDHIYARQRYLRKCDELYRLPSEQLFENVYFTFQDDAVAWKTVDLMNPHRLMWANDFPHNDASWPNSQRILAEQSAVAAPEVSSLITRQNVSELYDLPDPATDS